eukprot:TRINITY_DN79966_c0_g1_i1.p1 TRINITY_DN79966_c0_g1~~TRINITY_DN79966_c0_g1_i1.p1  ORF type:complete len:305 (-),score=38.14 TRINITY_DN79966_c0_g1_i1:275-1189(-)
MTMLAPHNPATISFILRLVDPMLPSDCRISATGWFLAQKGSVRLVTMQCVLAMFPIFDVQRLLSLTVTPESQTTKPKRRRKRVRCRGRNVPAALDETDQNSEEEAPVPEGDVCSQEAPVPEVEQPSADQAGATTSPDEVDMGEAQAPGSVPRAEAATEISQLQETVAVLVAEVRQLGTQVVKLRTDNTALATEVVKLRTGNTALATKVATLQSKLSAERNARRVETASLKAKVIRLKTKADLFFNEATEEGSGRGCEDNEIFGCSRVCAQCKEDSGALQQHRRACDYQGYLQIPDSKRLGIHRT